MVARIIRENRRLHLLRLLVKSDRPVRNAAALRRNRLIHRVGNRSLLSYERLANALWLADACVQQDVAGSFVECGVWQGGSAALLAKVAEEEGLHRQTHLFDSFEGLPNPTEEDGSQATGMELRSLTGELRPIKLYDADLASVSHFLFDREGLDRRDVLLHQGWFQDVLPAAAPELGPIALLRIDADWYDSVRVCLEHLYPLTVPGGYVILDDYGGYPGCKKAWDEYAEANEVDVRLNVIDEYGVWFRKP